MQISGKIYEKPEKSIQKIIHEQKTVRTSRLAELLDPVTKKLNWQEEALARNVETIRRLNDRAQKAEEQLKRARRTISGMELDIRIARSSENRCAR